MYECEGGGAVNAGYFHDAGAEMPTDPDHLNKHFGMILIDHLADDWKHSPPLGRRAAEDAIAAAKTSAAALDTFLSQSPAATWWAGRSNDVKADITFTLATSPGSYSV